jgi:hypothetical protein
MKLSGWAPPVGDEVGGEAAHARSPSPGIKESRTKVSGDEGYRKGSGEGAVRGPVVLAAAGRLEESSPPPDPRRPLSHRKRRLRRSEQNNTGIS